jgi:hypothetical protein
MEALLRVPSACDISRLWRALALQARLQLDRRGAQVAEERVRIEVHNLRSGSRRARIKKARRDCQSRQVLTSKTFVRIKRIC